MRNLNFSVLALCCCFFVLTNNSLSQVPSSVPSNGLIGWWPFNGNGNDESGNGNNGSVYGATLAPDKNGILNSAYSFDGINDRIEFTDKNFSNIKFSVSIWVNAQTSSGYRALIGKSNWSDSQSEGFGICLNSSEILYSIKGSSCSPGQVWSGAKFTKPNNFDNNWQHIVMTFDGATKSIYMNNKLIEKSSFQHTPINCQGGQIRIGAWWQNDPQWFKGSLDDLGIWNRVLTQEEITALFQSSNTTISNSIIQTWKHTQGTFAKTEKKSINGLPIWNENNGQFQYEETSSSTTQTILRDLNRQGVLIKLTNDQCLYKDNGLTDYRLLYNGSWQNKPEINGDAESFYKKGLAFYESKNYSEALTNFTRAIEIKPDYRSAYWGRGYLRRTLDDHEGFLNDFKKVIELDPDIDINVFLLIASSKLKLGNADGALIDVNKVITVKPNLWEAHYTKARILFVKKDYAGCILSAENVLKISPNDADAYFLKAMSEGSLGQIEKSCASFNKSISLGNYFAKKIFNDNKLDDYCSGKNKNSSELKSFYELTLYKMYMDFTSTNSSSPSSNQQSTQSSTNQPNQQAQKQNDCSYCKGSGKCSKCTVIFRKPYIKPEKSSISGQFPHCDREDRNETKLGYVLCNGCYGWGFKLISADKCNCRNGIGYCAGDDCYGGSCIDGWVPCDNCNSGGKGDHIGQCQWCKGTGKRN